MSTERDIDHRIRKLEAVAPNKVKVETGTMVESRSRLTLVKQRGTWMIDKNAGIEAIVERTIVIH